MWLGWIRTGDSPFEWVQQITGSDVYVEYGKKHGEGFDHLGVIVTDMDEAIKDNHSSRGRAFAGGRLEDQDGERPSCIHGQRTLWRGDSRVDLRPH